MEDWYNQYMLMDMVTAAKRLGMNIQAKRMGPCPACKAEKGYSKKDDRPPLRIFKIRGTERWKCSACDATGNIFDLVSLSLYEVFAGDLPQFSQLKAWIGNIPKQHYKKNKYVEPDVEVPEYPPAEEVRDLIMSATPIWDCKDARILEWCEARKLDPKKMPAGIMDPDYDCEKLTQVQTSRGNVCPWWPSQWKKEFNILIPLVDFQGNLVSVVGRSTWSRRRKSTVPISFSTKNLYFANKHARRFLDREETPENIWFTEGEIDYLTIAQLGQPVIGIRAGSMDMISSMKWQAHQTVFVATDNDDAGHKYAMQIAERVYPACPRRIRFDVLRGEM
tara:strand:+ start:93 stop:1094 length:1002 start_codon:yes stop_codon:yes gene_type:complete